MKSGLAQIVDARELNAFSKTSIPGAINIPGKNIANGDKIKDKAEIGKVFASLSKNKPVVAYTDTGVKAAVM